MTTTEMPTRLDGVLDKFAGNDVPGVVVGVFRDGVLVDHAEVGFASVEHRVPATTSTLFDIASSSKQVTSTCVLLLEQDGLLSLDDDLRDHLTGMRLRHKVSLGHCAQHTAGLREFMALNSLVGAGGESWKTEEQVVSQLKAYLDTDFAPGTDWSYSNTGYIALAAVVRAVSGSSLAEFALKRVLSPLGMTSSHFSDDVGTIVPGKASGYAKEGDRFVRADSPDEIVGDGGLVTSVLDLGRWMAYLADGRVLGTDLRDRLLVRAVLADGKVLPYALGIEHEVVAGHPGFGHGGAIDGYRAHLLHLPDDDLSLVVLANRSDADVAAVARDAVVALLGAAASTGAVPKLASFDDAFDDAPIDGLWFAPQEDTFLKTESTDGNLILSQGPASISFAPSGEGAWKPESLGADVTIRITGDRLDFVFGDGSPFDTVYQRVQLEEPTQPPPVGVFLSPELGALAQVTEADGVISIVVGATPAQQLDAVWPELYRTPSATVHIERDERGVVSELLVSGGRMRRVRFGRVADDARPVGFPVALGGPAPDQP